MRGSEPSRANPPKFQIRCYCSFQPKFGPSFWWQSGPTLKGNKRFFSPLWTLNHSDFRHNTLRNNGLTLILLTISPLAQTYAVPCAINKMADRSEQSSSNNSCKGKLNPEEWKRNKRTSLRNRGKEYETVSKSGRKHTFAAKQLGKDYHWLLKCFERVTQEQHENGSRGFLGAWRLDCTECLLMWKCESQVSKAKDAKKAETSWHSQKNYSCQYYINDNGISIRVFKKAFLAI